MMKRVYICAPLGGNTEENLKKVRRYAEYALRCGTGNGYIGRTCAFMVL